MSAHFVLPARRTNPLAFTKLQIAKAYALSRSCNPRNVEFCSYGLWSQCLMDLTSDSRFLIVIPQHLLYYVPTENSEYAASDSEGDSNPEDLANTTFSTIDSRTSTKPESSAEEILPDFAIIRVKCRVRNHVLRRTWLNVKIQYAGVPMLVEVKRAGSRSLDGVEYLSSTMAEIGKAYNDLFRQAAYLFTIHQRQQSVVLVACSGVYWSCRIIGREMVMDMITKPADDFQPDDDDDVIGGDDSDDENDELGEDLGDRFFDEDELDLIGKPDHDGHNEQPRAPSPFEDRFLEPVVAEEDLALPEDRWSRLFCLDSRASNQAMFLIHSRLRGVVRDNTGTMG